MPVVVVGVVFKLECQLVMVVSLRIIVFVGIFAEHEAIDNRA